MKNHDYYLAFSYFNKIGPANIKKIENYFPNLETAFNSGSLDLKQAGLKPDLVADFMAWRSKFNLDDTLQELSQNNINYVTRQENEYPSLLKEIASPPPIIYYKGHLDGLKYNRLAVVGARKHSTYGEKIIKELLPPAIEEGLQIVSGLALGIDSIAHQTAVSNNGITLAVLGSGLNSIYPRSNLSLAQKIIDSGGAIISEFPPKTPPCKQNFPQRNRIISGLSQAIIVIEAQEKSGALITARFALDQNREVLAVPGNIFSPLSIGPNNLIKSGAKTVTKVDDILETFQIIPVNSPCQATTEKELSTVFKDTSEKIIYNIIKQANERAEKITTDEIIKLSKLDTPSINSKLSILEIRGYIKNTEYGYELI